MNKTNTITTKARQELLQAQKIARLNKDIVACDKLHKARRICGFINNRGWTISGYDIIRAAQIGEYGKADINNGVNKYKITLPYTTAYLIIITPKTYGGAGYIERLAMNSKNGVVRIGKHRGIVDYLNECYAVQVKYK